jgi:hypothetical protein
VTVNDGEKPKITCPANITQNTDAGKCTSAVNYSATASDNCDGNVGVTLNPPSGSTFPVGTSTVTATAADKAGNTASCSFTVTVKDMEKPKLACPQNVTQSNDAGKCSAVVSYNATATDNCDGTVPVTFNPASGSTFPVGTTTVTATASDKAGNTASCMFTVTVNDTEKPKLTCPQNITQGTDAGKCSAMVSYSATATDSCGGTVGVTFSPASGSTFPVGTTPVTATASDKAGNTASCMFTVTVNDTEKPKLTCPSNITQNNDAGKCSAVVTYSATATDNCDGTVQVVFNPPSGTAMPVGTTTVTATASDKAGNTASCTFTVTVKDTEKPMLACPTNITKNNDAGKCSAVVTYSATATDNCDGTDTVIFSPASGSTFPVGKTTVTATATDKAGNTTSCSFTVTVQDKEAPQIRCPQNITQNSDANSCGARVIYSAGVTDNCDGTTDQVTFSPPSGTMFPVGTTTVTATANDKAGNTASCSFTVTVNEPAAPCDNENPLLQGRIFFSQNFTPNHSQVVQGPSTAVGLDAPASQLGQLTNGGLANPNSPFDVYPYQGFIPGFPEVGHVGGAGEPVVYLIMFTPLVSGNNWVVNPNSPNANSSTTASFRNCVSVRDGLFMPPATPSGSPLNSTYVIRMLFSHPFMPTCGAAGSYTITGLNFSGSEPNLYTNTYPSPGSPNWQRLNSVPWSAGAGPPPPSQSVVPPGWMAQTIVQFQQDAGKSFHLFVDGIYGDGCGKNVVPFAIHPEGDASPADAATSLSAAGTDTPSDSAPSPE